MIVRGPHISATDLMVRFLHEHALSSENKELKGKKAKGGKKGSLVQAGTDIQAEQDCWAKWCLQMGGMAGNSPIPEGEWWEPTTVE